MQPNGERPYRQGDVLLIPTDDIPESRTPVPATGNRLILAEGEATGHHHAILLEHEDDAELYDVAGEVDRWLRVRSLTVPFVHDEHGTIPVTRRGYIAHRQLEYHPAEVRRVAD